MDKERETNSDKNYEKKYGKIVEKVKERNMIKEK